MPPLRGRAPAARCLVALVAALSCSSPCAAAKPCLDENDDCGNWAASGECKTNPAYMHQSCRKSCGLCKEHAGGGGSSGSGGKRSSSSTSSGKTPAEKPATAAELLGDRTYTLHAGKIAGGAKKANILHSGAFRDVRAARAWCDARRKDCVAFTIAVPEPKPVPTGPVTATFLKVASSIADDVGHVSYVRSGGDGSGGPGSGGPGSGAGVCEGASARSVRACAAAAASAGADAFSSAQVAAYYLRVAELLSDQSGGGPSGGPSGGSSGKAQEVIDQVRAALLSGADRDACYMLRAHAYLRLENVDSSRRDLSAILRSDPEHAEAKRLHRQLKKWQKALDEGERQQAAREWAGALARYEAARDAISPPLETLQLRHGMCVCALRSRDSRLALTWCEKAHARAGGTEDELPILYLLVDAKVQNGEENAAVQLLKTAQRRFPRSRELHDKIQNLERRIRNRGKVNYYKVLGVSRTASAREVKRAYHQLAKQYHPDKVESDADKPAAEAMFKKVARAYEVLGDDELRRRYDAGEDVDDPNAMSQSRQQQQQHPFGGGFHGGGFPGGGGFAGGGRRTHHFRYR